MLKRLLNSVINAALKIGAKQLQKINNVGIKRLAMFFVSAGHKVANIFLDDDKDNETQLKVAIRELVSQSVSEGVWLAKDRLSVLKDEKLKNALVVYLAGFQKIITVLVDDNPNNEEQVKEVFEDNKKELIAISFDLATDKLAYLIGTKITDPNIQDVMTEVMAVIGDLLDGKK